PPARKHIRRAPETSPHDPQADMQEPGAPSRYRIPPEPIPAILDARPAPALALSLDRRWVAVLGRESLPGIQELAEPELRLAGIRINPRTHGPSREAYLRSLSFRAVDGGEEREVTLPEDARIGSPRWSPDGSRLAFTNTTSQGVELWLADLSSPVARRLSGPVLNATLGAPYTWLPDGSALLAKQLLPDRVAPPETPPVPEGPVIQENSGRAAPARTYQDLLENPHQERLFEHHFMARLVLLPADGGDPRPVGDPGIFSDFTPSPDGRYLLVERIHRPFSYLVPWYRFPALVEVWDGEGRPVPRLAAPPLADDVPVAFDAAPDGPRGHRWRADAPATLVWVEALDGGDPRRPAEERDRVVSLDAPFTGEPRALISLEHRAAAILWGHGDLALVYSRWWNTRNERRYAVRPDRPEEEPRLLSD